MIVQLTPHFTLEELTHSDTAVRLGIDNTPPAEVVAHLKTTAQGMETVRALLGGLPISVSSGFRCEELEKIITKRDYERWCNARSLRADDTAWARYFAGKAHPKGFSVDWVCWAFGSPLSIVRHLARSSLHFDQLIQEGTWVHVSFDPRMRGQVLTASFSGGVPTYTSGV